MVEHGRSEQILRNANYINQYNIYPNRKYIGFQVLSLCKKKSLW